MAKIRKNIILDTDSYKVGMWLQYPNDVTNVSSYIEARKSDSEVVFAGLQPYLLENLENYVVTKEDVDEAYEMMAAHGEPFPLAQWTNLIGKPIPLRIQAVPEGTVLQPGNVMAQIVNTDPQYKWMTTWFETPILRSIWYATTVATLSRKIKKVIKTYLEQTADNLDGLNFKLHDFGFRGVSSWESGVLGGTAHLINFMGTDTIGALQGARTYYNEKMAGYSIPASEHSVICAWGRDGEVDAMRAVLERNAKLGFKIIACVSDTYNIYDAVEKIWGGELRDLVINSGATLVIRPDSGDPCHVILTLLKILEQKFKCSTNSKGYKMLPDYIRLIWGDGINRDSVYKILCVMKDNGWSADNIAFGMGGALLQAPQRDDLSFAMKGSAISKDGGKTWTDIWKDPVTSSSKRSMRGRLALTEVNGRLVTIREDGLVNSGESRSNLLEDVYVDGKILRVQDFSDVRARAAL